MKPRARNGQSLWRIFRWPLLAGLISGIGLVAALLTNTIAADLLWACAVAVPVAMIAWFGGRSGRRMR